MSTFVAFLEEEGDADGRAGLEPGGLDAALVRVAAKTGISLDDFQLDEVGRCDGERRAVPERHDTGVLLLEPRSGIGHGILVGRKLLVGIGLHEMPEFAVGVQIVHVEIDDIRRPTHRT